MRREVVGMLSVFLVVSVGCGGSSSNNAATPSSSEVAASVVSGAINNSGGTALGWQLVPVQRTPLDRFIDQVRSIGKAYAATWTCTGGTLNPTPFAGPGKYAFTPWSCTVAWANGKSGSSQWSGTFILDYGVSCDSTHPRIVAQAASCSLTRTTASGGNTRTITGPNGNSYAITHDTNGAGTGWDTTVSPAPTSGGVIAACGPVGPCATGGGTLIINGSHLAGTVTLSGQSPSKIWDHTVSTAAPMTFTAGTPRLFSGAVTVQHNLARYTAISTFNSVGYGDPLCCFPTTGNVTTTFLSGPSRGTRRPWPSAASAARPRSPRPAGAAVPSPYSTASSDTSDARLWHQLAGSDESRSTKRTSVNPSRVTSAPIARSAEVRARCRSAGSRSTSRWKAARASSSS
jgi:hypothetical protein